MALMANLRAQAVDGGNLQAIIARVAQQYGASRHRQIDPGNCRCANGLGNCVGCGATSVHKEFQRVRALNGQDGQPGASIADPLFPGTDGHDGVASIHVRHADGTRHEYTSRYELELVDFDVEDENGDGIFEPGEHLFIRRIRVRNTGMSSVIEKGPPSVRLTITSYRRHAFADLSYPCYSGCNQVVRPSSRGCRSDIPSELHCCQ